MKLRGILALSLLLLTSAAQADVPVARILCGESSYDSWRLTTLRSDVFPTYIPPTLDILDDNGKVLHGLSEAIPVMSNGLEMSLFVIASPFKAPPVLYKSVVSVPKKVGKGERVASIVPASGTISGLLSIGEFNSNRLGYSALGLLAYPMDSQAYTILNTKTGKTTQLKLSSADAVNPRFSPDGKWLALEVLNTKTLTITTKIYSLTSAQVISLPTAAQGLSQIALSFVGDSVTWTEAALVTSANGHATTLRAGRLAQLSEKSGAKTLMTDKNPRLKALRVYATSEGQLFSATSKEAYVQSDNSSTGLGRDWVLSRGEVYVTYFNKDFTALSQETLPYHQKLIGMSHRTSYVGDGILGREVFFAGGNQLLLSLGDQPGVVSLNIKTKGWNFHASTGTIRCYNPALGPEVAE